MTEATYSWDPRAKEPPPEPPRPAMEYAVMAPTITATCGICRQEVYTLTATDMPRAEAIMAALVQHWLKAHTNACPYCWHYVPAGESPVQHRRECAFAFEDAWHRR